LLQSGSTHTDLIDILWPAGLSEILNQRMARGGQEANVHRLADCPMDHDRSNWLASTVTMMSVGVQTTHTIMEVVARWRAFALRMRQASQSANHLTSAISPIRCTSMIPASRTDGAFRRRGIRDEVIRTANPTSHLLPRPAHCADRRNIERDETPKRASAGRPMGLNRRDLTRR
jgi:hypothetical protein